MVREATPEIWLIEDADVCKDKDGKAVPVFQYVHKGWEPDALTVRAKSASSAVPTTTSSGSIVTARS